MFTADVGSHVHSFAVFAVFAFCAVFTVFVFFAVFVVFAVFAVFAVLVVFAVFAVFAVFVFFFSPFSRFSRCRIFDFKIRFAHVTKISHSKAVGVAVEFSTSGWPDSALCKTSRTARLSRVS